MEDEAIIYTAGGEGMKPNTHKCAKLYERFNIDTKYTPTNDIKIDDDMPLFQVTFVDKKGTNDTYSKHFNTKDCDLIRDKSKIKKTIGNDGLTKTIIYCLSPNNTKHNIKYNITQDSLKIWISYKSEVYFFDIEVNIPKMIPKIDVSKKISNDINDIRKELQLSNQKLTDKSIKLDNTVDELKETKNKLAETEEKLEVTIEQLNVLRQGMKKLQQQIDSIKDKHDSPTIRPPVLFTELYDGLIQREKGWTKIELNHCDSKDDDIIWIQNDGEIKLNKGRYIIKANTFLSEGRYTQLQFKSNDDCKDPITLYGNVGYAYDKNYVGVSSFILDQMITIDNPTTFHVRVHASKNSGGSLYFCDALKDENGFCHGTSVSISKVV